ncbi:prevent-host-death protein (plasmid) [Sphingomonas psychrotolerans]|uniref:Prevent-host-death protein n=2 Tax=Sphingomonas psychrotolerans TaxID=1327635 RepID=A0A2K8MM90_9SPHN|nr:prevent-host-death protein [Sphingomonas psychrotolerans]
MPQTASSVEVSKSFGRFGRQALESPLTITHHGHESLVLLSHAEYLRLKSRDRQVYALDEVPDDIAEGVRAARAPSAAAAFDNEVGSDA